MLNKTCMKLTRTTFEITGGLFFTISAFGYFFWYKPEFKAHQNVRTLNYTKNKGKDKAGILAGIRQKALQAKGFIKDNGLDSELCFLLDMRVPSGKERFFVYNLKKDSVEIAGLVTHGSGSANGNDDLKFSNVPNSYCTSLGKYKIGNPYIGKFGLSFKLHGLEKINNKAFDRFIVLHAHECVPDVEVYPFSICLSLGCPTVSPQFLKRLKSYLDKTKGPILLWIYY